MKRYLLQSAFLCAVLLHAAPASVAASEFSFGVISHAVGPAADESALRTAIDESDADKLAFVVVNGLKAADEPCTDDLYNRRKTLLQRAKNGLVVSLAASDWAECKSENGKSAAIGKLNRLRELFFVDDEFSIGASRIPLARQSTIAKFRSFAENARWEIGNIMFATVNVPRNNNHYVSDAGRNSEFEDRLVANRDWLHRIFTYAKLKKLDGIVLFCDGNPLTRLGGSKRDGYAETRRQITALALKFRGKVLIVHNQTGKQSPSSGINWRGNLGELDAGSGWIKLTANPSDPTLFTLANKASHAASRSP